MTTAVGFIGRRLTEARQARGVSATDLASMVEISAQSLSKYENGHQVPRHNVVEKIAATLGFAKAYFFREFGKTDSRPVFWRSKLSAQVSDLDRASVRLEWMKEIVDYLGEYFDFPQLNLLDMELPEDPTNITNSFIENAANQVREHWSVSHGPLPDVLEKIEENGVLVSRIHVFAEKVDAFSQWSDRFQIPFIMLSRDKASAARQRFDALHELAHVLLHKKIEQRHLNHKQTYKILEKQADTFASYMLLPEQDFIDELYAPTLDGMLSMKERWGVSVAAMIMRCKSLEILDDYSSKKMWMNYTRRGWRKGEPFDGKMEKETPYLIRRSFELLLEEGVQSVSDIRTALPFPLEDMEELADLDAGTLGAPVQSRAEPILKVAQSSNVVSLAERR